jgi:hypothetical protein
MGHFVVEGALRFGEDIVIAAFHRMILEEK